MTGGVIDRVNGRLTSVAVGSHLSYRAARARLTLLYGGLFVLSGAALMVIAYLLLVNAGFVFSLPATSGSGAGPQLTLSNTGGGPAFLRAGTRTHPTARTMAYWRTVATCMRQHGISGFPEPRASVPPRSPAIGELSDRGGAILAYPQSLDQGSASYKNAAQTCGVNADGSAQLAQQSGTRDDVRSQLLLQSAIALAAMSLLSLGLGWFLAGRVLQPLEVSHEAQRQFVANASHELRAPLTRLRALVQVTLADPDPDVALLRATHERVLASERQLEQLIDGLLTLSRSQAGVETLDEVDLAALVTEALLASAAELESRRVTVSTTLAWARTEGDRRLLERLIGNLVANAIRHNVEGGHIALQTGVRDHAPFVALSNTGPVIGAEHVQRLLVPFERMGAPRTGHDGGHGLGLSIVRAIADAHRAELAVTAQPSGGLLVEVVFREPSPAGDGRAARAWGRRVLPRPSLGD